MSTEIDTRVNTPFISEQLDEFFENIGVSFISFVSVLAIFLGLLMAFLGSRGKGPQLLGFVAGFLVGCYFAAIVLESIDENNILPNDTWVGLFFGSGVLLGIFVSCLASLAKIVVGIAAGLTVSAMFFQIGFAALIKDDTVLYVIAGVILLAGVYLAYKIVDLIYAILAAFMGGFLVMLGVGNYTDSPITLNLLTTSPTDALEVCVDQDCYIPVAVGGGVILISLIANLIGFRRKQEAKKKIERSKEDNSALMQQMQDNREGFEARFLALEERNQELLREMNKNATTRDDTLVKTLTSEMQKKDEKNEKKLQDLVTNFETKLAANEAKMVEERKQAEERRLKDLEDQRLMFEAQTLNRSKSRRESTWSQRQSLVFDLEHDRKDLEDEMEAERENLRKIESHAVIDTQTEQMIQDEKERKAQMLSIQQEIAQSKLKLKDLETDFNEAARIERRMVVVLPKELRKKKGFFEDENEKDVKSEAVKEIRMRAEEFAKYKQLVKKTKNSQKQTLKTVKKALKEVEKLSSDLKTFSMKNINAEDQNLVRKEKEHGLEEMQVKMTVFRTLIDKYEGINKDFIDLISEMEGKMTEFKDMEQQLEEQGAMTNEEINQLPTASLIELEQEQRREELAAKHVSFRESATLTQADLDPNLIVRNQEVDVENPRAEPPTRSFAADEILGGKTPKSRVYFSDYFDNESEGYRPSHQELNERLYQAMRPTLVKIAVFFGLDKVNIDCLKQRFRKNGANNETHNDGTEIAVTPNPGLRVGNPTQSTSRTVEVDVPVDDGLEEDPHHDGLSI